MDLKERLFEDKLKGYCCSESIMNLCLEDMGWSPEDRRYPVKSMGAFCTGLGSGLVCGTLSAAMAAIFIAEEDRFKVKDEHGPEMMEWFRERFGSWNCDDLLEGDQTRKQTLCPIIVEDTYIKLRDMLEDIGAI